MRIMILSILLFAADLAFGINYPPTYYIPAGGQTLNNLSYDQVASQTFYVTTSGSVNMGSNTYTLTYGTLPSANTTWNVVFDATNLTLATTTNVNIFGTTPLSTYYPIKKFYINFSVVWDAGVPSKKVTYFSSLDDLKTFAATTTFNNVVTFNDRVDFNDTARFFTTTYLKPAAAITAGQTVASADTLGRLTYGCIPWCVLGNSGLTNSNFLGNTDSVGLNFRVNNVASGRIDYVLGNTALGYTANRLNTSGGSNVAIGYAALYSNTTASQNVAIGVSSSYATTTGGSNVGIGANALTANTTGGSNTTVGTQSLPGNTTGSNNTAIGYNSLPSTTTGTYNIGVGYGAGSGTAAAINSISIGKNAAAASYQLAIAGIRSISLPNVTTAIRYVLTDTSGTGDFIPQPLPANAQTYYTSVTGDSITPTTQSNLINPAGTIANLTIRLPASPYSGQILQFTSTKIITALHWSTALNQSNSVGSNVPYGGLGIAAGQMFSIQFNTNTSTWYNY